MATPKTTEQEPVEAQDADWPQPDWEFPVMVLQTIGTVRRGSGKYSPTEAAFVTIARHLEDDLFQDKEFSFEAPGHPRCSVSINWSDE